MVFCPSCTLHSDGLKAVVVQFLGLDAGIDRMCAEILREGTCVETYAHLPDITVPAACATTECIAHTTKDGGGEAVMVTLCISVQTDKVR